MLLPLFHLSVIVLNSFSLWYDQMYVDLPFPCKEFAELPWKARQLFLTVWCLVLQIVYFSISLLNDVAGTNSTQPKNPPLIRKLKDILFSLVFPLALYVSTAFWSLYFAHKDFIMPKEIEDNLPAWINHVMHTFITPFIVLELLITRRNYPSRKLGMSIVTVFNFAYTLWLFGVYLNTGHWVYPFMDFMNWPLRFVFCAVSIIGGLGFYILGEKINYAVSPSVKVGKNENGVNKKN